MSEPAVSLPKKRANQFAETKLLEQLATRQQKLVRSAYLHVHRQASLLRELRALRHRLASRELRLRELSHRVKNELQAVGAMLETAAAEPETRQRTLRQSLDWLSAIAAAHEMLARSRGDRVSLSRLTARLAEKVFSNQPHALTLDLAPLRVNGARASAFGLSLNELLANIVRHAFPTGQTGRALVSLKREGGQAVLKVSDDGCGFPIAAERATGGLSLVRRLVERELKGSIAYSNCDGAIIEIRFPLFQRVGGTT